ncbi:MAG: PAS domain-containing protein [Bacteroidota bacterium]
MLFIVVIFFLLSLVLGYSLKKKTTAIEKLQHDFGSLKEQSKQISEKIGLLSLAEHISKIGTWEVSLISNQIRWSAELFSIYGFESNNFQPTKQIDDDLIAPEYLAKVRKEIEAAINSKSAFAVEYQIIQPSGLRKYVLNQGYFIEDSQRLVGTIQDITPMKDAVLKLKINETLLREAEAVSHSGSWEWVVGTESILWSDEMYRIHGFLPHSVFISLDFYHNLIHEEDLERCITASRHAYKNQSPLKISYRIKTPAGEVKHVLCTAEYKRIGLNDKFAYIGNTQDITELREAQVQLDQRMLELRRSNQDLEQFAYVASHDLQEPLRKIQAFGLILKERFSNDLGDEAIKYLDKISDASGRMRKLIDDLLTFSKATRDDNHFVSLQIKHVFNKCIRELDYAVESKNAILKVDTSEIVIDGVETQLVQLFLNLLGNSLKFNDKNMPVISITTRVVYGSETSFPQSVPSQKYCIIEIKDNGIGFDNSDSLKMFDIFHRLNSRLEYEGTGIGLALCKKIIENHSGYIAASGVKNVGATFTLALPEKHNKQKNFNE